MFTFTKILLEIKYCLRFSHKVQGLNPVSFKVCTTILISLSLYLNAVFSSIVVELLVSFETL